MIHYENLKFYLKLGLKLKKINTHKRIEAEKHGDKNRKALSKKEQWTVLNKEKNNKKLKK